MCDPERRKASLQRLIQDLDKAARSPGVLLTYEDWTTRMKAMFKEFAAKKKRTIKSHDSDKT
jgi:hypothetical protein